MHSISQASRDPSAHGRVRLSLLRQLVHAECNYALWECNYCATLCILLASTSGIVSGRHVFAVLCKSLCCACLPTVFDLVLPVEGPSIVLVIGRSMPGVIRMHSASLRAVAHRPEVAMAPWWNNQDPGRLLSQCRTLSGPCSGLLPFVDRVQ